MFQLQNASALPEAFCNMVRQKSFDKALRSSVSLIKESNEQALYAIQKENIILVSRAWTA
ncbi:MAG: hypothetical protein AAB362_01685 [Patescibacteria group bacterium]